MRVLSIGFLALALAAATQAGSITYTFPIDGLQEVPPVPTPAYGTGIVTLDPDTNTLSWDISYLGLLGTLTAAHFHAPAPPGQNAGVALGIPIGPSPMVGQAVISDALEGHILNGLTYVNLHTSSFPSGEIRGQVVPEPGSCALLGLAALAAWRRR